MSDETEQAESDRKLCPGGHYIGKRFKTGKCTKLWCAEGGVRTEFRGNVVDEKALAALPPEEQAWATRKQLAKLPAGLAGDAAQQWAQKKLVDLLPEAVASVAYDLRYGTDKVRAEAADKVLRANGLDKREAAGGGGGLIVLNLTGADTGKIPWLERLNSKKGED